MARKSNLTIQNLTRRAIPGVPFDELKKSVLGDAYELSLTFVGDRRMRRWNSHYRQKDKTTNILSFPLSSTEGEIFINLRLVPDRATMLMLFIHGLYHLKGHEHGIVMEQLEEKLRAHYGTKTHHGNRHRNISDSRDCVRVRTR